MCIKCRRRELIANLGHLYKQRDEFIKMFKVMILSERAIDTEAVIREQELRNELTENGREIDRLEVKLDELSEA